MTRFLTTAAALSLSASAAFAAAHAPAPAIEGANQDVSAGTVAASMVVAPQNGWLVVHRTDADMKPGVVVAHAPLRMGENTDVAAILTDEVKPGEMLMLMVHGEDGGMAKGQFEYSLGANEDGPIKVDGNLVMTVITAE